MSIPVPSGYLIEASEWRAATYRIFGTSRWIDGWRRVAWSEDTGAEPNRDG
jgi:hypothetical protein